MFVLFEDPCSVHSFRVNLFFQLEVWLFEMSLSLVPLHVSDFTLAMCGLIIYSLPNLLGFSQSTFSKNPCLLLLS